jgi:hypothetical protein
MMMTFLDLTMTLLRFQHRANRYPGATETTDD